MFCFWAAVVFTTALFIKNQIVGEVMAASENIFCR